MSPEIQLLLDIIDRAYDKPSWHGPNLRAVITRVSADEALWRPGKKRHNIWELVLHAAYWKYAVRRRLLSAKRGSFEREGSNWFAVPVAPDESEWRAAKTLLQREHRAMREVIAGLSPADLPKKARGAKVPNGEMIYGVAAHDLYHGGQIQLIKKMQRE